MPATRHSAEVTDPVTQEMTTLTADTAEQLEQLVDEHLASRFPEPVEGAVRREDPPR